MPAPSLAGAAHAGPNTDRVKRRDSRSFQIFSVAFETDKGRTLGQAR